MRISQILLSKPNLIIHPAIFPPLSADADRPPQTASAGADTVSAGPKRPSMDEMPAICCVYTLRLFSRTLLTAFDALMIPPHRPSGLPVRCSHIYSGVELALLSQLEFPALPNFQPEHVSGRKSGRREFLRGFWAVDFERKVTCRCLHAGQAFPCLLQGVTSAEFTLRWRNKPHDLILNVSSRDCATPDRLRRTDCCLLIRIIE